MDDRPQLHLIAPGACAEEAAAIVAALETMLRGSRPAAAPAADPASPWLRAALLEGVARAEHPRPGWNPPGGSPPCG